jgi:pre-rRNA-processing protein TSR4
MLQVWRQTLFPERELAIEDEEGSSGEDEVAEITEDAAEVEAKVAARARADKELLERINRETEGNGFEAEDARSEGARALQAQSRRAADRSFRLFKRRIRRRPAQVLRYGFPDGQVLWASDQGRPAAVPPCANCGAARVFEFQVMPQLLLHLNIDHADREAPDWGSLVVFSCPRSCGDGDSGYLEEFAWFHPMT